MKVIFTSPCPEVNIITFDFSNDEPKLIKLGVSKWLQMIVMFVLFIENLRPYKNETISGVTILLNYINSKPDLDRYRLLRCNSRFNVLNYKHKLKSLITFP